jgi:hypothetical protein
MELAGHGYQYLSALALGPHFILVNEAKPPQEVVILTHERFGFVGLTGMLGPQSLELPRQLKGKLHTRKIEPTLFHQVFHLAELLNVAV